MSYNIQRNNPYSVDVSFESVSTSASFSGTSLTNQVINAVVYNDLGQYRNWSLSNNFEYLSGTNFRLNITNHENHINWNYGAIIVVADEIEPTQIDIEFSGTYGVDKVINLNTGFGCIPITYYHA